MVTQFGVGENSKEYWYCYFCFTLQFHTLFPCPQFPLRSRNQTQNCVINIDHVWFGFWVSVLEINKSRRKSDWMRWCIVLYASLSVCLCVNMSVKQTLTRPLELPGPMLGYKSNIDWSNNRFTSCELDCQPGDVNELEPIRWTNQSRP